MFKLDFEKAEEFSSVAQLCPPLCHPMNRSTPGLTVHHQLPESTQTHVYRVGDDIQPSHPLSSPSPPAPNPSPHQVFSSESTLRMRWPKYWSFSFSISPSNEYPGLISFRKGRGTRDQIANISGSSKKQESSRKTSASALLTMPKLLTVRITTKCGKFLKRSEYQTTLTCLLRNLHAGQGATVRTRHGTTDWFQIGQVHQDHILSPCLFNLYAEYIMHNAGLDRAQARIKIAKRNINNVRYADDTTLMAEIEEELKSLLMKVKEES